MSGIAAGRYTGSTFRTATSAFSGREVRHEVDSMQRQTNKLRKTEACDNLEFEPGGGEYMSLG